LISTLEKEITFRFLKARKKDGFLNVISIFSFIGISLGVAVLIIVMSVMNGFRTELINKIVGFNSHVTVKSYEDKGIDQSKLNNKDLKLISENIIFSNSGEAIIFKNIFLRCTFTKIINSKTNSIFFYVFFPKLCRASLNRNFMFSFIHYFSLIPV